MILMVITHQSAAEREYMVHYTREFAGDWTDEYWKTISCATDKELCKIVERHVRPNILLADITMDGVLDLVTELRSAAPEAYIILVANSSISPIIYMKPTIRAESLMLKPLDKKQINQVLSEAFHAYLKRFYHPDDKKVFVVESAGSRNLIEYEKICYFEARDKRIYLNTDTEQFGFYDTIDQLEKKLSDGYLRCHRSFLVNKSMIKEVYLSQNRLVLDGDIDIPLSRTYKPLVKEYLEKKRQKNE